MRLVKPGPASLVEVDTSFAATRSTLAAVVVRVPVLEVALEPVAPTEACSGLTGSRPRYSTMRTSG